MSLYVVTDKSTGAEVIRYCSSTVVERINDAAYPLDAFSHVEADPENPVAAPTGQTRLTRLQFVARMGEAATVAIVAMAQSSAEVAAWMKMLDWATPDPDGTSIDLKDDRTIAGLNAIEPALIAQGVVATGWVQGVLNG